MQNQSPLCFIFDPAEQTSSANNHFRQITSPIQPNSARLPAVDINMLNAQYESSSHYCYQNNQPYCAQTVPNTPATSSNNSKDQNASPMVQNSSSNMEASPLENTTTSPLSDGSIPDGSSFYSKEFERKLKRSLPFIKSKPKKRFLNGWSTNTNILQSYPEYNETHPENNQNKYPSLLHQAPHQATPQQTIPKLEQISEFPFGVEGSSPNLNKTKSKVYECKLCNIVVSSKANLLRHFYKQHSNHAQIMNNAIYNQNDSTEIKMDVEDQLIENQEASSMNETKNWKCNQCEKCFSQHEHLTKHITKVHSKNFSCKLCLKPFPSAHHAMMHFKACSVTSNLSQTAFGQEKEVVENVTPGTKTWDCDKCDKSYLRKEVLMDHVKGKHMQNFNCQICSNTFSNSYSLNRHIKSKACLQSGKQGLQNNLSIKKEIIISKGIYPKQETFDLADINATQGHINSLGDGRAQINNPILATSTFVVTPIANQDKTQIANLAPYHLPRDTSKHPFESILYKKLSSSDVVMSENGQLRKWICLVCKKLSSERYKIVKHCKRFHSRVSFAPSQVSDASQVAPDLSQVAPDVSQQAPHFLQPVPNLSTKIKKTIAKQPSPKSRITPNLQCEFCSNRPTRPHDLKRHTLNMHKKCVDCIKFFSTKEEVNEHLRTCYRKKTISPKSNGRLNKPGRKAIPIESSFTPNQVMLPEPYNPTVYHESAVSDQSGVTKSSQNIIIPPNSLENKNNSDESNQTLNKKMSQEIPMSNSMDGTCLDKLKPIRSEAMYENGSFMEPCGDNGLQPTEVLSLTNSDNPNRSYIKQPEEAIFECNICKKIFSAAFTLKRHVNGIHLKLFSCQKCNKSYATNYHKLQHQLICNKNPSIETIHQPAVSDQDLVQFDFQTFNNNLVKTKVPQEDFQEEIILKVPNNSLQFTSQGNARVNVNNQGLLCDTAPTHQESVLPKLSTTNIFPYYTNLPNNTHLQISSANFNYIPTKENQTIDKTIPRVQFDAKEYLHNKPGLSIKLISKPAHIIETKPFKVNFVQGTSVYNQTKIDFPVAQEEVLDLSIKPKVKTVDTPLTLPKLETESNSPKKTIDDQKIDSDINTASNEPQHIGEGTGWEETRKKIVQTIIFHHVQRAAHLKMFLEAYQNNVKKQNSIAKIQTNPLQTESGNIPVPTSTNASFRNSPGEEQNFNQLETSSQVLVSESTSPDYNQELTLKHLNENETLAFEAPLNLKTEIKNAPELNEAADDQIQAFANLATKYRNVGSLKPGDNEINDQDTESELEVKSPESATTEQTQQLLEGVQQCPDCLEKFNCELLLARHIKRSHGRSFQCPECPKFFLKKDGVTKHYENKHRNIKHKCDHCTQTFGSKFRLDDHINGIHKKIQIFECKKCDQSFTTRTQFYRHKYSAHPKNIFSCKMCNIQFKSKHSLESHMNGKH